MFSRRTTHFTNSSLGLVCSNELAIAASVVAMRTAHLLHGKKDCNLKLRAPGFISVRRVLFTVCVGSFAS